MGPTDEIWGGRVAEGHQSLKRFRANVDSVIDLRIAPVVERNSERDDETKSLADRSEQDLRQVLVPRQHRNQGNQGEELEASIG